MFVVSILITLLHALEERYGPGGPLWRYFGDLSGLHFRKTKGLIVTILLPSAVLVAVSGFAYVGQYEWAISLLFGARVGDAIVNHGALYYLSSPNPGMWTALGGYISEAAVIAYDHPHLEVWPGIAGVLMFGLVVPTFKIIAKLRRQNGADHTGQW